MKHFSKKVLAASVAAAVWSAAGAADKAPTLGDIFKASGVDVTGYIDASYTNFDTDTPMFQANTTEKNSFNLNAADLAISSLPASGVGGMVELMAGEDVTFNKSRGWTSTDFDVLQAFAQYAMGPFAVMGGKFTTLAGAEVPQAPANANISRSLLYTNAIPATHTGLRGVFTASDTLKFTVGLNNGWDIIRDSSSTVAGTNNCTTAGSCADGKTVELGVSATPVKPLTLAAAYYSGEEYSSTSNQIGNRSLIDAVVTFNVTDALTLVLNYDAGEQEKATATAGTAKWNGLAGYVNYAFTDKLRGSFRLESFDDKSCFRTTCAGGASSQKLKEATLTVGYMVAKGFELRGEYRKDDSDGQVFTKDGTATDKQTFYGVEAVYKF